jgi:hypothetical protein
MVAMVLFGDAQDIQNVRGVVTIKTASHSYPSAEMTWHKSGNIGTLISLSTQKVTFT